MEPILIATDGEHSDVRAVTSFTLDMAVGHDRQDFTACFERMDGVGGGSFLYIDGTEYGGVVDDVTTGTGSGIAEYHGRTWDGVLAAKVILPPDGADYRVVSGEANAVLASLVELLDVSDVFRASAEPSGITVPSFQFNRFTDAYTGIQRMLRTAGARLKMERVNGRTVLSAVEARVIQDEADSDLVDFELTATNRTVNHLVCLGTGELQERVVIHLYADAEGNVSRTQTLFGVDEVAAVYDYSNAEADELLDEGTKKLKEYQTQGSVDITGIGSGDWDIGDTLVARDNASGTTVSAPIVGKTVKVDSSTNWQLRVEYKVGEASRTTVSPGSAESSKAVGVTGVKGNAETAYRSGNVNITPADIGAVSGVKGNAETAYRSGNVNITPADIGAAAASHEHSYLASKATITGASHAAALKAYFDANKASIPRSRLVDFYSSAYSNGSLAMGYFLGGYDSTPYGGFFVAHYGTPKYVGIQNGVYTEYSLQVRPTVLYNNATGTTGTVTLSQTAAGFNHMRVHFKSTRNSVTAYGAIDVYSPNGKRVGLHMMHVDGDYAYHYYKVAAISGTSMTVISGYGWYGKNTSAATTTGQNHIYVVRVEAWNE